MSPKAFTREEELRILEVKGYILNHLQEDLVSRRLAKKAALGAQKFKDEFYRLFGKNVGGYIHESRMMTGKFLLTHTERTIKEIAKLCGYKEYKSFLRAYKKYFGTPAGRERKS